MFVQYVVKVTCKLEKVGIILVFLTNKFDDKTKGQQPN
jgi:hypothetical protein